MSELENVKAVLDYLNTVKDTENYKKNPPSLNDWLKLEKERLNKEYDNLCVINADDRDIISQALIEMSNKYNVGNQFQVANKIDEVRRRFLDNKDEVRRRFPDNETEKFVKTNLNFYIKVKLNEHGKQIHYDYWKDTCERFDTPYKLEADEKGYFSFQIHEFMNVFGEHAHLGAEPFLETNDVLIERSKK